MASSSTMSWFQEFAVLCCLASTLLSFRLQFAETIGQIVTMTRLRAPTFAAM